MLNITGAGAQPPMRSHWKLRPGPQSHKKQRAAMQARHLRNADVTSEQSEAELVDITSESPLPAGYFHGQGIICAITGRK